MAEYGGTLLVITKADEPFRGQFVGADIAGLQYARAWFQSAFKYSGQEALKMAAGGIYTINYGCRAGAATITVRAWAPQYGKLGIRVVDPDTKDTVGEAVTTTTQAWELLTVSFTAQQKVYLVMLFHGGVSTLVGTPQYGYFDDLV